MNSLCSTKHHSKSRKFKEKCSELYWQNLKGKLQIYMKMIINMSVYMHRSRLDGILIKSLKQLNWLHASHLTDQRTYLTCHTYAIWPPFHHEMTEKFTSQKWGIRQINWFQSTNVITGIWPVHMRTYEYIYMYMFI